MRHELYIGMWVLAFHRFRHNHILDDDVEGRVDLGDGGTHEAVRSSDLTTCQTLYEIRI